MVENKKVEAKPTPENRKKRKSIVRNQKIEIKSTPEKKK